MKTFNPLLFAVIKNNKFCAAEVMFGLVELGLAQLGWEGLWWGWFGGQFFIYISSRLVSARLHTENWLRFCKKAVKD